MEFEGYDVEIEKEWSLWEMTPSSMAHILGTHTKTLNNHSYFNNFLGSMQGSINSSGQNIIAFFRYPLYVFLPISDWSEGDSFLKQQL